MSTLRIVASQALVGIGVGSLVSVTAGCEFHFLYDTPLSPRGAVIVVVVATIATTLGKRLTGIPWRQLGAISVTFLGFGLAAGPIRSFTFAQLDGMDAGLIAVGIVMIVFGFRMLRQPRQIRDD